MSLGEQIPAGSPLRTVRGMDKTWDAVVIGAGPAGTSFAIHAAKEGLNILVLEKNSCGRDKPCGDGLTPRAIKELQGLGIETSDLHRIDGLRIVNKKRSRETPWPVRAGFGSVGAAVPRAILDKRLQDAAQEAGVSILEHVEAASIETEGGEAIGVRGVDGRLHRAPYVAIASGAGSAVAAGVGAGRSRSQLQGIAIRSYATSTLSDTRYLEASIEIPEKGGLPGYGWVFPLGDGTVNIGYGYLTRGEKGAPLRKALATYHAGIKERWGLGEIERDWAWRLPMRVEKRHGAGWVALGDAAGLVNPCNGEGVDYALESGRIAAETLKIHQNPAAAAVAYERILVEQFDWFLEAAARFAQIIKNPSLLDVMLRGAMLSETTMRATATILGNVMHSDGRGALESSVRVADWVLRNTHRARL